MDMEYKNQVLATGGVDHHVRIYDLETNKQKLIFNKSEEDEPSHWNRVYSIKFDPYDPQVIYSGGWDKMVSLMDLRTGTPVAHINGPYVSGDTVDVRNNLVLTGSYRVEDPLEIWDVRM